MTRWRRPADREAGSLTPAIAIMGLMFLLLIGLIVDSSRQLTARGRAVGYAEEAARAGAQGLDLAVSPPVVDRQRAEFLVGEYCADVERTEPAVTCRFAGVDGNRVQARADVEIPAGLLGIVGITTLTASGEGTAEPVFGVVPCRPGVPDDPNVPCVPR